MAKAANACLLHCCDEDARGVREQGGATQGVDAEREYDCMLILNSFSHPGWIGRARFQYPHALGKFAELCGAPRLGGQAVASIKPLFQNFVPHAPTRPENEHAQGFGRLRHLLHLSHIAP
jgi:hypothetical protein